MSLTPYPTDVSEPALLLLTKLKGGMVPTSVLAHAAYQVQGVAMSYLIPDGSDHPVMSGCGARDCTTEEHIKALSEAANAPKTAVADAAKSGFHGHDPKGFAFDWKTLLSAALKILEMILAGQQPNPA